MGHTSAGYFVSSMDLVGCVLSLDKPQALTLGGGALKFIAWCLRNADEAQGIFGVLVPP